MLIVDLKSFVHRKQAEVVFVFLLPCVSLSVAELKSQLC